MMIRIRDIRSPLVAGYAAQEIEPLGSNYVPGSPLLTSILGACPALRIRLRVHLPSTARPTRATKKGGRFPGPPDFHNFAGAYSAALPFCHGTCGKSRAASLRSQSNM